MGFQILVTRYQSWTSSLSLLQLKLKGQVPLLYTVGKYTVTGNKQLQGEGLEKVFIVESLLWQKLIQLVKNTITLFGIYSTTLNQSKRALYPFTLFRINKIFFNFFSAGVGRSGAFITIDSMIKRIHDNGDLNVFSFLAHIRQQRNHLVQEEVFD